MVTKSAKKAAHKAASLGNSPMADLASKTTSNVAAGSNVVKSTNFSGQYFLERFVTTSDQEEITKMDIVRQAVKVLDSNTLANNLGEMVTKASDIDAAKGFKDKQKNKGPTYKTAQNVRTVILRCYGAIKFATPQLEELGFTNKTGFHTGYAIAVKALEKAMVKWDGSKADTPEERKLKQQFRTEERVLSNIKKATPRHAGESLLDYERRCMTALDEGIKAQQEASAAKTIDQYKETLLALGDDVAKQIAQAIMDAVRHHAKPPRSTPAAQHQQA